MDKRPNLDKDISLIDFQEFYWLKDELVTFCRQEGIKTTGGKVILSNRIEHFLRTGTKMASPSKEKPKSKFDWKKEPLTLETQITDNYKNTENVRQFFEDHIGKRFKFNVKFMNWVKLNSAKTLGQAIHEWKRIDSERHSPNQAKEIAPQFEYNRYLRDFLADNPHANRKMGIVLWKIMKSKRGDNVYRREDLKRVK